MKEFVVFGGDPLEKNYTENGHMPPVWGWIAEMQIKLEVIFHFEVVYKSDI